MGACYFKWGGQQIKRFPNVFRRKRFRVLEALKTADWRSKIGDKYESMKLANNCFGSIKKLYF